MENTQQEAPLSPKVIEPMFLPDMPLQKAAGEEEVIDWEVAIKRLKKVKEV